MKTLQEVIADPGAADPVEQHCAALELALAAIRKAIQHGDPAHLRIGLTVAKASVDALTSAAHVLDGMDAEKH